MSAQRSTGRDPVSGTYAPAKPLVRQAAGSGPDEGTKGGVIGAHEVA